MSLFLYIRKKPHRKRQAAQLTEKAAVPLFGYLPHSLLGIALAKPSSFPVGKVNFMQSDPMTFSEFLLANGDENLVTYLKSIDTIEPIPDAFFNPLYEKLKMYYVTGGMPESVKMWTEARDVEAMQEALSGIIGAYERDFAKHPDVHEFPKISMIWKSVPSQLARENKKFIYKVVKEGARAREYEDYLCRCICTKDVYLNNWKTGQGDRRETACS